MTANGTRGEAAPLILGHRGASRLLPENTLAAFRAALDAGADGVELDVRLSADGVPVVIHDASLLRTTGVRGRVADRTAAELAELEARGRRASPSPVPRLRSGGGVPTLEAALDLVASYGACAYVEIKGAEPALAERVVGLLERRAWRDRVVVLSFNHAALRRVRRMDGRVATAATLAPTLRAPRATPARLLEAVERAGASEAALHVALATRRRVEALRGRGLRVSVWTVNSVALARRLERLGVDAIMTDCPERLVAARGAR